jgi:hypothetical protein
MKTRTKIIIWISPLLLIFLEVLGLIVICSGLTVPWRFVGNPSENIARIIGYKNSLKKLYVLTVSGEMYSLSYNQDVVKNGLDSITSHAKWVKENEISIEPDQMYDMACGSPKLTPLFFREKQLYRIEYQAIEGCGETWFGLSQEGNLWVWYYDSGLCEYLILVIGIPLFPIEILAYLFAILVGLIVYLVKIIRRSKFIV